MEYDVTIQEGKYANVESGWDIHGLYDSIPLMQYTGIKDKNGKEIYEGDVVEYQHHEEMKEVLRQRSSIGFSEGSFVCPEWGEFVSDSQLEDCEVIGNIYENPELLTNGKEPNKE